MKDKVLKIKRIRFAVLIVNPYKYLCNGKKVFVVSQQLLQSRTLLTTNR